MAGPVLVPADADAALEARLWDRFADQHLATPMQKIVTDRIRPEGGADPQGVADARAQLDVAYGVADDRLARSRWLAGDAFTVADCAAAPALFYCRAVHRWDEAGQANITRYYRDLMTRPAIARVVEEARPYRDLFPHPWPADTDDLGWRARAGTTPDSRHRGRAARHDGQPEPHRRRAMSVPVPRPAAQSA
jgi:glutathione S-transferase